MYVRLKLTVRTVQYVLVRTVAFTAGSCVFIGMIDDDGLEEVEKVEDEKVKKK